MNNNLECYNIIGWTIQIYLQKRGRVSRIKLYLEHATRENKNIVICTKNL